MDYRDYVANAQGGMRTGIDYGLRSVLDRLGLQQKPSALQVIVPTFAVFGAGLALGAVLGFVFAPKRGEELRHDIRDRLDGIKERSAERYQQMIRRTPKQEQEAPASLEAEDELRGVVAQ